MTVPYPEYQQKLLLAVQSGIRVWLRGQGF